MKNEIMIDEETLDHQAAKKVLSLLGIAQKAGYISSGEFSTEKSVKEKKASLVIVAADASDNTKKMFANMCAFYNVSIYFISSKNEIGHSIGKEFRASLAVNDAGMAGAIEKQLMKLKNTNSTEIWWR